MIIGASVAFYITIVTPTAGSENLFYIFICGTLAICAMILPGISGSFILLLLGVYATVLGTISDIIDALRAGDWNALIDHAVLIGVFMVGCVFGLISFSKILNYLFKKNKPLIIAILTGFLIGSLNKIWPWKETLETSTNSHGEIIPLVQQNIMPSVHQPQCQQESRKL